MASTLPSTLYAPQYSYLHKMEQAHEDSFSGDLMERLRRANVQSNLRRARSNKLRLAVEPAEKLSAASPASPTTWQLTMSTDTSGSPTLSPAKPLTLTFSSAKTQAYDETRKASPARAPSPETPMKLWQTDLKPLARFDHKEVNTSSTTSPPRPLVASKETQTTPMPDEIASSQESSTFPKINTLLITGALIWLCSRSLLRAAASSSGPSPSHAPPRSPFGVITSYSFVLLLVLLTLSAYSRRDACQTGEPEAIWQRETTSGDPFSPKRLSRRKKP